MRLAAALLIVLTAFSTAPADDAAEEGFVPIFNGENLDGWVVMGNAEGFRVEDGVIHSDGNSGAHWMRTQAEYGDFILKLEWKVSENGNSGVFVRSDDEGEPWLTGYEIQISNEPRDDAHCTGSLYGYASVNPRPDESFDTWHTFEVHCIGGKVTVISDGVQCVDFDQSTSTETADKPMSGYIGLQDSHSPDGHYVEYRNIRIKEIE